MIFSVRNFVVLLVIFSFSNIFLADCQLSTLIVANFSVSKISNSRFSDSRFDPLFFGLNFPYASRADFSIRGGDLIFDRSLTKFPASATETSVGWFFDSSVKFNISFGSPNFPSWNSRPSAGSGILKISAPTAAPGFRSELKLFSKIQLEALETGEFYHLQFAIFSAAPLPVILIAVINDKFDFLTEPSGYFTPVKLAESGQWKLFGAQFEPSKVYSSIPEPSWRPILAFFFFSEFDNHIIHLDEVRMFSVDKFLSSPLPAVPVPKPIRFADSIDSMLRTSGISSLRWPGGSYVDVFNWKDSVGSIFDFGEISDYFTKTIETPAVGLVDFLLICRKYKMAPFLQINVNLDPVDTEHLLEFLYGSNCSAWGAERIKLGIVEEFSPFSAEFPHIFFQFGNEPSLIYSRNISEHSQPITSQTNAGSDYSSKTEIHRSTFFRTIRRLNFTSTSQICNKSYSQISQIPLFPSRDQIKNQNFSDFSLSSNRINLMNFNGHPPQSAVGTNQFYFSPFLPLVPLLNNWNSDVK